MPTWKEYMKQQTDYASQFPQYLGNIAVEEDKKKKKKEKDGSTSRGK
jgi:hypothetical protein